MTFPSLIKEGHICPSSPVRVNTVVMIFCSFVGERKMIVYKSLLNIVVVCHLLVACGILSARCEPV